MLTQHAEVQVTEPVSQEVLALCSNKEAIAKILTWDSYGTMQYSPDDIQSVSYKGDILRFNLSGNRATVISIHQLFYYHQLVMENQKTVDTQEIDNDTIVELAKEIGTAVWEHGCKLGYVVHFGGWFYAITEILTPTGFKYSHSRHGSFYLAQSELIERSWEVEAA